MSGDRKGTAGADSVREKEEAAVNAGDLEGFVALFTDDAVIMPPNLAPITGKDNIREFNLQFFQGSLKFLFNLLFLFKYL